MASPMLFFAAVANSSHDVPPEDKTLADLYPAIVQCFVVISCGYLAGRTSTVSSSQAQGIGNYVTKFALPALLFRNMCTLQLSSISWYLLGSFLLAKTLVFIIVAVVTVIFSRENRLGKAALYSIFSTQSNDFALGYPIVSALFAESHPHFVDYLYLVAPISLAFLNPIGFLFLEIERSRSDRGRGKCQAVLQVIIGVISNPIVFMTVFGIAGNFAFGQKLPKVVDMIFQIFGDSYSATALFYLGHSMVGKIQKQTSRSLIIMALLVTAKQLLLPFVCRGSAQLLLHLSDTNVTERIDMESYAFLYGTFPTAPSVFLFASHYSVSINVIASSLVVCTFLSGPLMFISSKMVMMRAVDPSHYMSIIQSTTLNVSAATLALSAWVLGVFFIGRRLNTLPHQMIICLIFSQMISSVGIILEVTLPDLGWIHVISFTLTLLGTFSSRVWSCIVAISICVLSVRGLCRLLHYRCFLMMAGFCIPASLTALLVILNSYVFTGSPSYDVHVFGYSVIELSITLAVCVVTMLAISSSLIILNRHNRLQFEARSQGISENEDDNHSTDSDTANLIDSLPSGQRSYDGVRGQKEPLYTGKNCSDCDGCSSSQVTPHRASNSIEDIVPFPRTDDSSSSSDELTPPASPNGRIQNSNDLLNRTPCASAVRGDRCSEEQHRKCIELINKYRMNQIEGLKEDEIAANASRDQHQIARHMVFVLFMLLATIVEFSVCILRLYKDSRSGVRIEIEFLNCVLVFGQGIFVFLIFGLDTEVVISPFVRRLRRLFFGASRILLPPLEDIPSETKVFCNQFIVHHRDKCMREILGCRRYRLRRYRNVFLGSDLVHWLLKMGLCTNESTAVDIGSKLLYGRVIQHIEEEQMFYNMPLLYRFVEEDHVIVSTVE